MKEITRIHIAKVSYDIELAAKEKLEGYLKALEIYSDAEVLNDIEIRITEILLERGVKKGGVIAEDDVNALKKQLGDPSEFMETGDIAVGSEDVSSDKKPTRKLYRNVDNAVFGGVLSGIAAYLKVSPLWIRLIFIVLAFGSFGTVLLVYAILWIVVPPAKTAADKLQMTGRTVTVASIRELNENDVASPTTSGSVVRVVTLIVGIGCVIGALGAATVTTVVTVAVLTSGHDSMVDGQNGGFFYTIFSLMVSCGLLLTALFVLAAYASFVQKITRRVLVSMCVVIVLGLASFGTAVGFTQYLRIHYDEAQVGSGQMLSLPSDTTFHGLTVTSSNADIVYVPDAATPRAELQRVSSGNVSATVSNDTLTLNVTGVPSDSCMTFWCSQPRQKVTVHGPELEHITTGAHTSFEYRAATQSQLTVVAATSAEITVSSGTIDTMKIATDDHAQLTTSNATISHVDATVKAATQLTFGTIESLSLSDQKACPSDVQSRISVWKISGNTIMLNGVASAATTTKLECTVISIESEDRHDRS